MRVTTSSVTDYTVGFDGLRAVVGAGDGVVGRFPGIVCVARCSDPEPLRQFLSVCAEVAGPEPGRALARRLATWMSGPDAPGQELRFGTIAAAGDKLAVYLVGEVDARVDAVGGLSLSGAHAAIGTDRLLSPPTSPVVLSMDGGDVRADPADVHDLRAGVVPGAGVVLRPTGFGLDDLGHAEERRPGRARVVRHRRRRVGPFCGSAAGRGPARAAGGRGPGGWPERGGSGSRAGSHRRGRPRRGCGRESGRRSGCGAGSPRARHARSRRRRRTARTPTRPRATGRRSADRPAAGLPGRRPRRPARGRRTRVPTAPRIRSTASRAQRRLRPSRAPTPGLETAPPAAVRGRRPTPGVRRHAAPVTDPPSPPSTGQGRMDAGAPATRPWRRWMAPAHHVCRPRAGGATCALGWPAARRRLPATRPRRHLSPLGWPRGRDVRRPRVEAARAPRRSLPSFLLAEAPGEAPAGRLAARGRSAEVRPGVASSPRRHVRTDPRPALPARPRAENARRSGDRPAEEATRHPAGAGPPAGAATAG